MDSKGAGAHVRIYACARDNGRKRWRGCDIVGRNKVIKSRKTLQKLIDGYFDSLKGDVLRDKGGEVIYDKKGYPVIEPDRPPTVSGLARACGFRSKQTLYNYRHDEKYGDIIDDALMRIEEYTESRLFDRDGARGAEFSLMYNFKYNVKQQDESNGHGGVVVLSEIKEDLSNEE